jgi:hypothetical protein
MVFVLCFVVFFPALPLSVRTPYTHVLNVFFIFSHSPIAIRDGTPNGLNSDKTANFENTGPSIHNFGKISTKKQKSTPNDIRTTVISSERNKNFQPFAHSPCSHAPLIQKHHDFHSEHRRAFHAGTQFPPGNAHQKT